jgi:hypothetical protein
MEVGVWRGKMLSFLVKSLPLMQWHGVDTWRVPEKDSTYAVSGAEISVKGQAEFEKAYNEVKAIVSKHKNRCTIHVCDSANLASEFKDGTFDAVFIDADHSYAGCKRDILAWKSKVKPGGILSGHDYANKAGDVKRAVDEVVGKVELFDDHVWMKRIDFEKEK